MEVPFEKIGPGQSGRLVYQVVGQGGPVWNPKNMIFLRPDQSPTHAGAESGPDLGAALAGINLLASAGILAISQQTLREVNRISQKLERMDAKLDTMDGKLDQLQAKAEMIDVKVSENNLRHGLGRYSAEWSFSL